MAVGCPGICIYSRTWVCLVCWEEQGREIQQSSRWNRKSLTENVCPTTPGHNEALFITKHNCSFLSNLAKLSMSHLPMQKKISNTFQMILLKAKPFLYLQHRLYSRIQTATLLTSFVVNVYLNRLSWGMSVTHSALQASICFSWHPIHQELTSPQDLIHFPT